MSNVMNALLNMVLVSIPEETFIVVMTLIFLRRFDLLDLRMWRQDLKWIMIPVLPTVIMINIFRYIIIIPKPVMSLSALAIMNALMLFIVIKNSYDPNCKLFFKTFLFTNLCFVIISLMEIIYIPLLLSLIHQTIDYFNNNILYNFLLALPSRIMEWSIVVFILVKKNNQVKVNLFDTIIKNKFFKISFIVIIFILNVSIIYIAKLIAVDNILMNLKVIDQVLISAIITSTPTILITSFLIFINYLTTKEKQIQQTYESLIVKDDLMD